ncbi:hypothetical protein B0H11DRAFT_2107009 [Mycena galericulata]|nr:hypothetical protein B0H11DRAFT_2107009 [Mycena galericulata]
MPENTSPGLFGPRSAQESRYGYGLHMIKPTSPSKRRPEAAASSGSRRHVPARATRKFGSDMASTPPLRERTGRRRAAAPGPDRGSQIQSWATWQPESALALIPPILEPTPWVLSQQHTAAPVPEPLSNVPAWMTWRPNPHYNLAPTPPSRDTTARVSHPRDVATPDPSLTPTPSLNEAALMEPGDYSPGLFGPSSSRESDASLTTTLPLQEAGLMEPGDYSPGPFGPRSPQLELPADSPSPQSPSVQFPNPPLSRDPDVPAWMTWRPNPALAPAPPLAHPTQRVLSRERRSVFPAPSPRPLMVPETESPGLSGPMSPPLRERTREPVLDKPLSPATVPAWMTWRNNPALSPAPPLAHPTQRVLSHERPSAFPAPSPRPPMVPETGSPGLFGPRSPPFTSRFSDY